MWVCVHAHVCVVSFITVVLVLGVHTLFTQQSVALLCFLNMQGHHGVMQCNSPVHTHVQVTAEIFTEYESASEAPEKR